MTLTSEEGRRLHVLSLLEWGQITTAQAAEGLGLTRRQVRRLRRALQRHGPEGLAHGNRNGGRCIMGDAAAFVSWRQPSASHPVRRPVRFHAVDCSRTLLALTALGACHPRQASGAGRSLTIRAEVV